MPYANNNGVKIYYEVEGEGPSVLLHHGMAGFSETWRENGYVDALKDRYRLVLMDARGHGKSDKPHDPAAYAIHRTVGDVTTVLDALEINRSHFFGYSRGGRIGLYVASLAPERVLSVIVGGANASAVNSSPNSPLRRSFQSSGAGSAMVADMERQSGVQFSRAMREKLMANDFDALVAVFDAGAPSVESDLSRMAMPFLLYAGEADPTCAGARQAARQLPNAAFFSLPGLNHVQALVRSDLVIPHIKEFLAKVTKANS